MRSMKNLSIITSKLIPDNLLYTCDEKGVWILNTETGEIKFVSNKKIIKELTKIVER